MKIVVTGPMNRVMEINLHIKLYTFAIDVKHIYNYISCP